MDTQDTHHGTAPDTRYRADSGPQPVQPLDDLAEYPPWQPFYPSQPFYPPRAQPSHPAQPPYPVRRNHPSPQGPHEVTLIAPAAQSVSPMSAGSLAGPAGPPYWIRRPRTWPQRAGGILIAAACAVGAAWYVPRVMSDDHRLLTGTVTSSGVIALNFTDSGEIDTVDVVLGETVRKGQVLAAEYDPNAGNVVAADEETISADQAKVAELKAEEAADPAAAAADNAQLVADKAQLAVDEAQLATDRMKIAAAEIVAPSAGIVVAANGQPGETVTSAGIRDYAADSAQAPSDQRPAFSLLPEGPQSVREDSAGGSALPVIALRISAAWQIIALIPEDSVSAIRPGLQVSISVPAAHIAGVRGQVDEVLPTPVSTSQGVFYQAVVAITGRAANLPLTGMAADVQLAP